MASFKRLLLDLSIPRKLTLMISVLSLAMAASLSLSYVGMVTLSAMRAYVGGEGHWSKAQKQAVHHLIRYGLLRHPEDYTRFREFLSVPEGDRQAREELEKPTYDRNVCREGFLRGRNHPNDLNDMIHLFRWFRHVSYMDQAIRIWTDGDRYIARLRVLGEELHRQITERTATPKNVDLLVAEVDDINRQLTVLEDAFSSTLGDAARWATSRLIQALIVGNLLLWSVALAFAFLIARHLTSQTKRLRDAAIRVAEGDYSQSVKFDSKDEIGDLSQAFQQMMIQRQWAEGEILTLNDSLEERVKELGQANKELDSFCYSVSHDLRAPLRAIDGFSTILNDEHSKELSDEGKSLLGTMRKNVAHMSELLEGLLTFSRLSLQPLKTTDVDLTAMVREIANEFAGVEKGRQIQVAIQPLGRRSVDPTLMRQVFVNLIGNAIKFTRDKAEARIEVGRRMEGDRDIYFVRDNGAGFDMRYMGKLFGVFQRLHSEREFEGTGVGLALVQRIITRHGGTVWADGEPGKGATFYFAFGRKA